MQWCHNFSHSFDSEEVPTDLEEGTPGEEVRTEPEKEDNKIGEDAKVEEEGGKDEDVRKDESVTKEEDAKMDEDVTKDEDVRKDVDVEKGEANTNAEREPGESGGV